MPYKTRPYLRWTFGLAGNPFIRHEVGPNEIRTIPLVGATEPFAWQGKASAKFDPRELRNVFGLGNVTVSSNGDTRNYKNLRFAGSFIKAVTGEHPDVKADIVIPPLRLSEDDLENFAYPVPYVKAVGHLFLNLTSYVEYMKSIAPNTSIRQGEKPFLSGGDHVRSVVAPCDGVFLGDFNYFIDNDLQKEKDLVELAKELKMGDVQIIGFFRPVKGQPTPQWIDFYDARNIQHWMSKIGNDKSRLPVELKGDQGFLEELTEAYRAMKMDSAPAIDMEKIKALQAPRGPQPANDQGMA